jgi:hypothetical protein
MALNYGQLKAFAREQALSKTDELTADAIERAIPRALRMVGRERGWTFLRDVIRANCRAPYTTGTAAGTSGDATITGSGTTWASATMNGQLFQFNGDPVVHVIDSVTNGTALELTGQVSVEDGVDGQAVAAQGYKIAFPFVALPDETRAVEHVELARDGTDLERMREKTLVRQFSGCSLETGQPCQYAEKRVGDGDEIEVSVALYPAPDRAYALDVTRYRLPAIPTLDADEIDWPEEHLGLLYAAVKYQVGCETNNARIKQLAMTEYNDALNESKTADGEGDAIIFFNRGNSSELAQPEKAWDYSQVDT